MPYNSKLFVLRIVTRRYNCLLGVCTINCLKLYDYQQTNDCY